MEILHLEDFSNETLYKIEPIGGNAIIDSKEPAGTRTYGAWGGDFIGISCSSSSYYSSGGHGWSLPGAKYIETKNGRMTVGKISAVSRWTTTNLIPFNIIKLDFEDITEEGTRTIHAFKYTPNVTVVSNSWVRIGLLNSANVELGFQSLHGLTVGHIEIVQESGWVKVYKDNVLIISKAHTGVVSLSARLIAAGFYDSQPVGLAGDYFYIENLAIIRVPIESPVKRLSNYSVKRSDVNDLNGVAQDVGAPVNNRNVLTDPGVELMGSNTLSFAPPPVSDTERIMGVQTTISVKSPDADTIRMALNDADDVLSEKDVELDAQLLVRVTLPAVDLGDKPVDYTDHTLHIDIKELEL